ncbi:DUF6461 domain-containing protein [Kitasatospora sp. NPDC056181]|uniref:DUF6461 domain-containing protein n=1 Tax=Kitasatospora sp. NPDC056181 TaxID=3345737 RepID=UPI0035DE4398
MADREPMWWEWAESNLVPVFCLNLVRGLSVGEVVAAYGADPERMRVLSAAEAGRLYPMAAGGALLRVGQLGGWTFCFEDREAEGLKPGVLARLCEHSEVVHLFYAVGMTVVERLENGRQLECFEPGQHHPPRGSGPHDLYDAVRAGLHNPHESSTTGASLQALARYAGIEIPGETLTGPLRTAYLPDGQREPLAVPPSPPGNSAPLADLGRYLGTLDSLQSTEEADSQRDGWKLG